LFHRYRQGHHSTSDDSTRYRDVDEIQSWRDNDNPLTRLRLYMESQGWWDEARETSLKDTEKRKVLEALSKAENKPDPSRDTMFDDVRLALLAYLTGLKSRLIWFYMVVY